MLKRLKLFKIGDKVIIIDKFSSMFLETGTILCFYGQSLYPIRVELGIEDKNYTVLYKQSDLVHNTKINRLLYV